uniref:Endoribonuclease n=1 Tax=Parastrongyloides trichosuri TaxID=131310 RepID=A0A0N4Z7P2_PARTI
MKSLTVATLFVTIGALFSLPIDFLSADVSTVINVIINSDKNKAGSGDITLNYQDMASHKSPSHDNAPKPLFTQVSSELLAKPSYVAFSALLATYTNPDINTADPNTDARNAAITNFFSTVKTSVTMQTVFTYLTTNKFVTGTWDDFQKTLIDLWFTPYGTGNSGFKEVFSGAVDNGNVVGLSNWVQFYTLEKANAINYHGWFTRDKVNLFFL